MMIKLPLELIQYIADYLDFNDQLRLKRVCKQFYCINITNLWSAESVDSKSITNEFLENFPYLVNLNLKGNDNNVGVTKHVHIKKLNICDSNVSINEYLQNLQQLYVHIFFSSLRQFFPIQTQVFINNFLKLKGIDKAESELLVFIKQCNSLEKLQLLETILQTTQVTLSMLQTACKYAGTSSSIDCVKLLINAAVINNPNIISDCKKYCPLTFAVAYCSSKSSLECVKYMLDNDGSMYNLNIKNYKSAYLVIEKIFKTPTDIICIDMLLQQIKKLNYDLGGTMSGSFANCNNKMFPVYIDTCLKYNTEIFNSITYADFELLFFNAKTVWAAEGIKKIINKYNVNLTSDDGNTLLHLICHYYDNSPETSKMILNILISKGAKINVVNTAKDSPLTLACVYNPHYCAEIVEILLHAGANPNFSDEIDRPLIFASGTSASVECINLLIGAGAQVNYCSKNMVTPLLYSIYKCNSSSSIECVKLLLNSGANPNFVTDTGVTPLHAAVYYLKGRPMLLCVRMLLEAGANPNIKNSDGKTCLDLLEHHHDKWYVEFCKKRLLHYMRNFEQSPTR